MQDQEIDRVRQVRRTPCPLPQDVDLVIFDCDGVLVDSEIICCAVLSEQLANVGVAMSADEVVRTFLGRDFSAVEQYVRRVTGVELPGGFREELLARTVAAFSQLQAIRGWSRRDRSVDGAGVCGVIERPTPGVECSPTNRPHGAAGGAGVDDRKRRAR